MPDIIAGGRNPWDTSRSSTSTGTGAVGLAPAAGMDLTSLTDYINSLTRQGQASANQARIPGAAALETASSANIGNELSGTLNPDVIRLLQQQGAERGAMTGTGSSPNNNAAYLQALGLTSMNLQQQGQRDLSSAYARNPAAPIFDPVTQLMTPYQSASLAEQQRAEQDRVALEQQRLALDAATAGGRGGGGSGGGNSGRGGSTARGAAGGILDSGADPTTRTWGGVTGPDLAGTFAGNPTLEWWTSLGLTPTNPTDFPAMNWGTTGFYAGPYMDAASTPGYQAGPNIDRAPAGTVTSPTGSSSGIDWGSLFSPDLGIDTSLYTGV